MVGTEYRAEGQGLLYLAAAFVPLSAVGAVYEAFARVERRLRLMMAVLCVSTFLSVFGSLIGTRLVGVVGVGWAYLAAESVSAAVLFAPTVLWLRRTAKATVTVRNTFVLIVEREQPKARSSGWLSDDVCIKQSTAPDGDAQEVELVLKPALKVDRLTAPPELRRIQIVAPPASHSE